MINRNNALTNALPPPPANAPVEALTDRSARNVEALYELNKSLARLRARLFGEGENEPDEVPGSKQPPLEMSIGGVEYETRNAHAQVSSILNRL